MRKRGLVVLGIGFALVLISFSIAMTVFPDFNHFLSDQQFASNLLADMFDYTSDEYFIHPGGSASFTYTAKSTSPLMWVMQIIDFQDDDSTTIHISNIFGDDFGSMDGNEPIIFDMFVSEKDNMYNFQVENTGDRTITVIMMFIEDPENSETFNNLDSPLYNMVLPLAISGIILIIGIIVIIAAAILFVMDWKKERNLPRRY